MLTVEETLQAIIHEVAAAEPIRLPLGQTYGLHLAEDVQSGIDSPPFDKSLMDGYAVRSADCTAGVSEFNVIEEVTAGQVPTKSLDAGQATRIMTGAPIPNGADAVVPVERSQFDESRGQVRLDAADWQPGANIIRQGTAMRRGETVLKQGRRLRPQELGLLAELGHHRPLVRRKPRVAVLATGDELVSIDQSPGPGQIRNSNETMLTAQIRQAGGEPVPLGIARDERQHLREKIDLGLQNDLLLLSGGVSAGKLDLVPSELASAGVEQIFHKVQLKPGKPLWFGRKMNESGCVVFGLPGNPVSSLVCFELFVRTAIRRFQGMEPASPPSIQARLGQPHLARSDRPTYHPAQLRWKEAGATVEPLNWQGSSDLRTTIDANSAVFFPAGERQYSAGESVEVFLWGGNDFGSNY